MKFAFSTVSCPTWDFQTVVARAREYGYDGVEVRAFLNESILTAANPFLTDPEKLRRTFDDAGVELCCLSSSIAMTQHKRQDARLAGDLRQYIDAARRLGCPLVKVFDTQVKAGQSRALAGVILGDWLLPLADYAADRGVSIVVENALSFRASKEMWTILDRLNHPSVGVCWDLFNGALIGEQPAVSVPTLNSKILYAQVKDAKFGPLGATYTKVGEGQVEIRNFLRRLRGIGYEGYVTVEWEKAWLPNLAEPEVILPDAITKLRDWAKPLEISDWEAAAEASKPTKPAAAGAKH
ncbi:MAG TPA: sugar phosphate isomerase/epimerase family protein [Tepidisphaeraceae bacterium]|nr:sugar phosphate isomerase/epimerase family protein [Tepidisphaeraceae bacterium]